MNQSASRYNTNLSLLGRLRSNPCDEQSWNEFVNLYGAMILRWCRGWGLQIQDAEEVTQNVLLQLARQMREFKYDSNGSFRSWLKTISRRSWCDFLSVQSLRNHKCLSGEIMGWLKTEDAANEFFERLDLEFKREQLRQAMQQVQLRVEPRTWQAFERTAILGESVAEVAESLNVNVPSVYVAKSRVIRMVQNIIETAET